MTTEKSPDIAADQPATDDALPDEALDQAGGLNITINFTNQGGNQDGFFIFQKPATPNWDYIPIAWQVIHRGS
ncbi:hypothetical protein PJ900_09770 [Tistrella mobilis]|uniref:Uncharacterized protein n=1 Tax=Tistrella mobilis TaxID=171437 RepID=A0A162LZ88_9PROT|nr:hypothetical protein [Tistrella mobilis]KYO57618.1 hypothetical protein AUP44_19575 [Tistrella mobilis]